MSKVINQRLIVLLTFVLTIFGCKKIDNNQNGFSNQTKVESFFKRSTNLPYAVQKIALLLKEKESKFHFIEKFVKYQGLPLWQNAIINLKPIHTSETSFSQSSNVNNNDTIVKIPIQLQGAQVIHGYLLCTISSDSVSIAVIDGRTYSEYGFMSTSSQNIVAENIVTEIMSFNHTIYNLNNFNLTDTRLFADSSNSNGSRIVIFDTLNNFNGNSNAGLCSGGSTIIAVKTPDCLNTYPCTSTWCDGCNGCYKWNIHSFCNQDAPSTSSPQVLVWTIEQFEDPEGSGAYPDGWIPTPDPCPLTTGISMIICDLGWNIVILPIQPPIDAPCTLAKIAAKRMDSMYLKSNVDSVLTTLNLSSESLEKGFVVSKRKNVDPYNSSIFNFNNYKCSNVQTGSDSGVSINFTPSSYLEHVASFIHTHPSSGKAAQSAKDIYELIQNRYENIYFEGNMLAAYNGDQYAITIIDTTAAYAFYNTMNQYLDGSKWNENSEIGKTFNLARDYYLKLYKSNTNKKNLAYEMAMAVVLNEFNTGVVLHKKDFNGHFQPLIINTATPNPAKPNKKVYTQECL